MRNFLIYSLDTWNTMFNEARKNREDYVPEDVYTGTVIVAFGNVGGPATYFEITATEWQNQGGE